MAAECGLKRLMLAFGMPYDTAKDCPSKKQDTKHADAIWARFESYRCGHHRGIHYTLPVANPFHDWKASQRYAHTSNFNLALAQTHQAGAQVVCQLIKQAQRDGLI